MASVTAISTEKRKELEEYITNMKKRGYSEEHITTQLSAHGYPKDFIRFILHKNDQYTKESSTASHHRVVHRQNDNHFDEEKNPDSEELGAISAGVKIFFLSFAVAMMLFATWIGLMTNASVLVILISFTPTFATIISAFILYSEKKKNLWNIVWIVPIIMTMLIIYISQAEVLPPMKNTETTNIAALNIILSSAFITLATFIPRLGKIIFEKKPKKGTQQNNFFNANHKKNHDVHDSEIQNNEAEQGAAGYYNSSAFDMPMDAPVTDDVTIGKSHRVQTKKSLFEKLNLNKIKLGKKNKEGKETIHHKASKIDESEFEDDQVLPEDSSHHLHASKHKTIHPKGDILTLVEYVNSLEAMTKTLNLIVGRVYNVKRGGTIELRDKVKIPGEWYKEFSNINKFGEVTRQLPAIKSMIAGVHTALTAFSKTEKEVFGKDIEALNSMARDPHGSSRIIDVLIVNDSSPVQTTYQNALDMCKASLLEIKEIEKNN